MFEDRKPHSGRAFRAALLTGVCAAALSLASISAQADDTSTGPNQGLVVQNGILEQTSFTGGNNSSSQAFIQNGGFLTQQIPVSGPVTVLSSTNILGGNAQFFVLGGGTTTIAGGSTTTDTLTVNQGASFANGRVTIAPTGAISTDSTVTANQVLSSQVTIDGGNAGGNVSTLTPNNAALSVAGGAVVQNGLSVSGGSHIDGHATFTNGAGFGSTSIVGSSVQSVDANGNTGNLTGSALTLTNGTNSKSTATLTANAQGGVLTLTNAANPLAGITVDASVDPVLTVTNGTAAGTTTINNGVVTAGTSINAPAVNATNVNTTNVNATNVNTKNLTATGQTTVHNFAVTGPGNGGAPSNIDMGGNVVHDVATPVVGTDAANKAYVDSGLAAANRRIDKADQGIAIAMSVQNPVLTGGDRFGVSVNWGDFAGNNAIGFAAAGVVGQNFFGTGEKMALTGGFGFGTSGRSDNQVSGRAGVQFTW